VYYHRHDRERSVNPQAALRAEYYANRITLFAEPSYMRTRQRLNFEVDVRSRRVEQGTAAGAEVRVLPKLAVEASVQQHRTVFDGDQTFLGTSLAEALNRESWAFGTAASWNVTPLTTVVVRAESLSDRFLLSPVRDSNSTRVTGGVDLKPQALIAGSARIGFRSLRPLDGRVPEFRGVVASASLSYTLLASTNFGLTVNRDTGYSFELFEPYYVATGYGITVRRHITGPFDAWVGFDRHRYAYRDLVLTATVVRPEPPRIDLTHGYSGSVGYRVGRTGRIAAGFTYWMRRSKTRDFRNYAGVRLITSFTYGI
jgi:hypothetical protein